MRLPEHCRGNWPKDLNMHSERLKSKKTLFINQLKFNKLLILNENFSLFISCRLIGVEGIGKLLKNKSYTGASKLINDKVSDFKLHF